MHRAAIMSQQQRPGALASNLDLSPDGRHFWMRPAARSRDCNSLTWPPSSGHRYRSGPDVAQLTLSCRACSWTIERSTFPSCSSVYAWCTPPCTRQRCRLPRLQRRSRSGGPTTTTGDLRLTRGSRARRLAANGEGEREGSVDGSSPRTCESLPDPLRRSRTALGAAESPSPSLPLHGHDPDEERNDDGCRDGLWKPVGAGDRDNDEARDDHEQREAPSASETTQPSVVWTSITHGVADPRLASGRSTALADPTLQEGRVLPMNHVWPDARCAACFGRCTPPSRKRKR